MVSIHEAIVVEGRYDKNTLSQIVDAPIFQTDGFGIMKNKELLSLLRSVARIRGLIVFTDADGAGFVIRNYLKSAIPSDQLKHAYTPDIMGKERRKKKAGKEGKLGVEGMDPQIIIDALRRSGATFKSEKSATVLNDGITKVDFARIGLSGAKESAQRRLKLLRHLNFPEHMSANALLQALNLIYSREEFFEFISDFFDIGCKND